MPTVSDHRDQIAQITVTSIQPPPPSALWRPQARSSLYFWLARPSSGRRGATHTNGRGWPGAAGEGVSDTDAAQAPSRTARDETLGQTPRANPTCRRSTRSSTTYTRRPGPDAPPAKASGGQTWLANRSRAAWAGSYCQAVHRPPTPVRTRTRTDQKRSRRFSPLQGALCKLERRLRIRWRKFTIRIRPPAWPRAFLVSVR